MGGNWGMVFLSDFMKISHDFGIYQEDFGKPRFCEKQTLSNLGENPNYRELERQLSTVVC
jgi:hypothetical protein